MKRKVSSTQLILLQEVPIQLHQALTSRAPSPSSTSGDSDPENNTVLCTEELEARIEVFLEEANEDLEMNDLPPLKNNSLVPVPAPVIPRFVPFAISTSQRCVLPRSLLRKVYHPYKDCRTMLL